MTSIQKDHQNDKKDQERNLEKQHLKRWMKQNGIWQKSLYQQLVQFQVSNGDDCKDITEKEFDEIIRIVRVERFQDLKDQRARHN